MPKKTEYVKFRNHQIKIRSPFIIYADLESNLVPEDNGKQNPEESYTNNIKNILFVVIALNQYVLMIGSASLLRYTQMKMLFTIVLIT